MPLLFSVLYGQKCSDPAVTQIKIRNNTDLHHNPADDPQAKSVKQEQKYQCNPKSEARKGLGQFPF